MPKSMSRRAAGKGSKKYDYGKPGKPARGTTSYGVHRGDMSKTEKMKEEDVEKFLKKPMTKIRRYSDKKKRQAKKK
jgi:hypothetical protein